jgi:hypothetical protein
MVQNRERQRPGQALYMLADLFDEKRADQNDDGEKAS